MTCETVPLTDDLRVNLVVIDGNLGVQVQKHGIQVFRVVLLDAARDIPKARVNHYGHVAPDLAFHVGNVFEQIGTTSPQ